MSNSNKSKKNNSIGSILGLNKLRNTTKKLGSSIESGFQSAKKSVTGTVDKATNNIMPDFVPETSNQQNNANNKNNKVSLGNLLIGKNNNNKKNSKNSKNNKNSAKNMIANSLKNVSTNNASTTNSENTLESNVEKVGNDLKKNATKLSGLALGMSWFKYFLLFMILLFFGINIFSYLAKTSTFFANITESIFRPIAKLFGFSLTKTVGKVVDTSAEGAKYGIDLTKDAIDDVLTLGDDENGSITNRNKNANNAATETPKTKKSPQDKSVASETSYIGELEQDMTASDDEDADPSDTNSAISYGGKKKGSYCYVGVDRGYRSCVKIADGEKCMSGKVFPSKELCVNPSLRA